MKDIEDDNDGPKIVMTPEAQAAIDADPELKAAMGPMFEKMHAAMADVKSGREPDFETAMKKYGLEPRRLDDIDFDEDEDEDEDDAE